MSLSEDLPLPRFADFRKALTGKVAEDVCPSPLDPAAFLPPAWSARLRQAGACPRAPGPRPAGGGGATAAARAAAQSEQMFQVLSLTQLHVVSAQFDIRGVCGLCLRDGECDALLDLAIKEGCSAGAADEPASLAFRSLRQRWVNLSQLLNQVRGAAPLVPWEAEWILVSLLVWLLGRFCTSRAVPDDEQAARRFGLDMLCAVDKGFVWPALSGGTTAAASDERLRCLRELYAAAQWDLRYWLSSSDLTTAPIDQHPSAVGVGHAWLGSVASLVPVDGATAAPALPRLDWHQVGLPTIHPDRHPDLRLQMWASVPTRTLR